MGSVLPQVTASKWQGWGFSAGCLNLQSVHLSCPARPCPADSPATPIIHISPQATEDWTGSQGWDLAMERVTGRKNFQAEGGGRTEMQVPGQWRRKQSHVFICVPHCC